MNFLDEAAAAPFTPDEIARLGQRGDGDGSADGENCIMPVPADAGPVPSYKKFGREADHRFEYRGLNGSVLGYVLRWDARDDQRKQFMPVTCWRNGDDKASWKPKAWPGKRPLFGLDRVAARPDAIVLLMEGEKKVVAVERGPLADAFMWAKHPVVGVAWPGGTNAIEQADFSPLAGRDVIIVPDNDEPGEKAADQLAQLLPRAGVRRLRRWKAPAECGAKWDIADAVPDNINPEAMVNSMFDAPEIKAQGAEAPESKTPAIHATPFVYRDPTTIPLRQYLYGRVLIRKFVSVVIGQTGLGKSSLWAAETLSQVSAKTLLGIHVPESLRVWLWNLEDPQEETERKLAAGMLHYGLTAEDIGDRLFVDSGRDQPLVIAEMSRNGAMIVRPVVDSLVAELIRRKIDIIKIDPFVSSHTVPENDNGAMDMVIKEWGKVADRANCAVELSHHARKTNGSEVTAEDGRGGVAFINGTRVKRPLNQMTEAEADKAGVKNNRLYFRIVPDTSLAPPADKSDWFKLVSVDLGNGPDGGDSVGVVTRWVWPDHLAGVTASDFEKVAAVLRTDKWRQSPQAGKWAGKAVAQALTLNVANKADKAKILAMLKFWLGAGSLVEVDGEDEKRMPRKFIEVKEED